MARRKHRKHSAEFKFKLVIDVLKGEQTRTELAREHDINKSLLHKWEQAFLANGAGVFTTATAQQEELDAQADHIADLERLVGQLSMENQVLKKFETRLSSLSRKNGRSS